MIEPVDAHLLALQQAMVEAIHAADEDGNPAPADHPSVAAFLTCIEPAAGRRGPWSAPDRLAVYTGAYRARLVEALADSFAHTQRYLGEDGFRNLMLGYIDSCPPTHYSLRWYGASLPQWLAEHFPDDVEVAELAALDAALRQAFDAADAEPLAADRLAAVAPNEWATLGFELQPGAALLTLSFNTVALWRALTAEEPPPAPQRLPQPMPVLVWRLGQQPHFRSLEPREAHALQQLFAGESFGRLCERLDQEQGTAVSHDGQGAVAGEPAAAPAAVQAATWLRTWLADGLLVGLKPD